MTKLGARPVIAATLSAVQLPGGSLCCARPSRTA